VELKGRGKSQIPISLSFVFIINIRVAEVCDKIALLLLPSGITVR